MGEEAIDADMAVEFGLLELGFLLGAADDEGKALANGRGEKE